MKLIFSKEVAKAKESGQAIVALESTVIAHGLKFPENIETALAMENEIRNLGAVPATIAVICGEIKIGLNKDELTELGKNKNVKKLSKKDLPICIARKETGATTVSTTSFIAHKAGIKVFATGGIGGVHLGFSSDVSADLPTLAETPITVVCSGPKSILDLVATREWLETYGISIIGYKCEEMPAFYSSKSGLKVDETVNSVREITEIISARDKLQMKNACLVMNPIPNDYEIDFEEQSKYLNHALRLAEKEKVKGKDLTPFLLEKMSKISKNKTLQANIALLKNNAKLAAMISVELSKLKA